MEEAPPLLKESTPKTNKIKPQYVHMLVGAAFTIFCFYIFTQLFEGPALVTILVFNLLSIILTFPLKGPLWCKLAWLGMGNCVGIMWNFVRFSLITVTTGIEPEASTLVNFFLGPAIDFTWLVPVWALGLSTLSSLEHRKRR